MIAYLAPASEVIQEATSALQRPLDLFDLVDPAIQQA
jgi:hypothetical protein